MSEAEPRFVVGYRRNGTPVWRQASELSWADVLAAIRFRQNQAHNEQLIAAIDKMMPATYRGRGGEAISERVRSYWQRRQANRVE